MPGQRLPQQEPDATPSSGTLTSTVPVQGWQPAFSPFDLPGPLRAAADEVLARFDGITEGVQWYQGDHSMFVQQGRPAIAVSSQWFLENFGSQNITHTPQDNMDIVDCGKIVEIAEALNRLIRESAE